MAAPSSADASFTRRHAWVPSPLRLMVLLCLGALTTVLMAWGFAFRSVPDFGKRAASHVKVVLPNGVRDYTTVTLTWYSSPGRLVLFGQVWGRTMPELGSQALVGPDWVRGLNAEEAAPSWARELVLPWLTGKEPFPPAYVDDEREVDACGWPFAALYSIPDDLIRGSHRPVGLVLRWDWPVHIGRSVAICDHPVVIPYMPVWRGALGDTVCFATAWRGVFAVAAAVRRRFRKRLGHCQCCGYDLSGLPAPAMCPECGSAPV